MPASDLRLWQIDDETVELGGRDQLAAQPTVRLALTRSEFEHRLLVVRLGRRAIELVRLNIDMTGGAHHLAAALGNDAVDAVDDRRPHNAGAERHIEHFARPVRMYIGDFRHRFPIGWTQGKWVERGKRQPI